jgi:uncharacterized membrane protein YccC
VTHLGLLERTGDEGLSAHRRAVLLAAITATERLQIQADRITIAAREQVPREVRAMVRPQIQSASDAIAAALEESVREGVAIRTGADSPPAPAASRVRPAREVLEARVLEVRPLYINHAGGAEVANFGAFLEALNNIVRLLERPLDEPPRAVHPLARPARAAAPEPDPALVPYCLKVGLCVVIGYVIGLVTQRADLSTILTTIIVSALPTYGASLRKAILRIVGSVVGGAISLLAIIVATPNFDSVPSYMMVTFVVLLISAYTSLSSGRVAYAGKQLGTTFLLIYADLSPSPDVYSPLWRAWGILLGTIVVAVVFFNLWPAYAGDSLLPRLRRVLRDTLSIAPGGAATTVAAIHRTNDDITQVLSEILQVADDARMEGRRSLIDHDAVVQSAGTIRRIAHRLATIAVGRIQEPFPRLDDTTEAALDATFSAVRRRLESWLGFYSSPGVPRSDAARALALGHPPDEIAKLSGEFISRVEANGFARIGPWIPEQRRRMLEVLQSWRRLEFLMSELEQHLAGIPGTAAAPLPGTAEALASEAG